jgi:zinc protease
MRIIRILLGTALLAVTAASIPVASAVDSPPLTVQVPPHERFRLPNGITVILMPQREVPLTAFGAVLRGGAQADPADKAGLAAIVAALLEKGAGSRNAYAFADAVAGVGGSFGASAGADSISISGQFLSRDRALMMELLADAILRPRLLAEEFDKLRDRAIESIKSDKDSDPSSLTGLYGRALLFDAHPYGAPQSGSERSLGRLTHGDAQAFYRQRFGADLLTLVFAGDIDAKWLRAAVRKAFGDMRAAAAPLPPLASTARAAGRKVLLVDSPESVQSYFWIGNTGVPRTYPHRAALDIVNTVFGGRFTSILNTELRVKSGLSYGASSSFNRARVAGEFAIRSFAQTENTVKAIDLALVTLDGLHQGGIDATQLESGRNYVAGQYPTRLETAAHWAATLLDLEVFGLDRSYIENYGPSLARVSLGDIATVVGEAFPKSGDLRLVVIGDAAKIRDSLRKYGELAEMKLTDPDFSPR